MRGGSVRLSESVRSALVLAPHADDEAMGCAGLLAVLARRGVAAHVVYLAVDGFHHYGLDRGTSYAERLEEIATVNAILGTTHEVVFGDQDLIERLDTLAQRDLVDRFEVLLNEHRPEVLLLPAGT